MAWERSLGILGLVALGITALLVDQNALAGAAITGLAALIYPSDRPQPAVEPEPPEAEVIVA